MEPEIKYLKDIERLAKEFDTETNKCLIDNITTGSGKLVSWVCEKGHKWKSTPHHRARRGQDCPFCAGKKPIKGETDLATVHPDIAQEWHPIKNGVMKPEDFMPHSNKRMWWLCSKGHEYETQIKVRARGSGCPYCWGRYVIKGETDLESQKPGIAKEWHPTKNGDIKPDTITECTADIYWWMCSQGHEYKMRVCDRTRNVRSHGCPYCSGKRPLKGKTDLGTVCKEATLFWDYEKNDTTPSDYLPWSKVKIWMKCNKGHSWHVRLYDFSRTPKCPYCCGKQLERDVNTLQALYPETAKKWNHEKNANTDIDTIHVGSCIKKFWWKCDKGHEWISDVAHMVKSKGKGCPYCSRMISKYSI